MGRDMRVMDSKDRCSGDDVTGSYGRFRFGVSRQCLDGGEASEAQFGDGTKTFLMFDRKPILIVCPTHRDLRELEKLDLTSEFEFLTHDYASLELEDLVSHSEKGVAHIADPIAEINNILNKYDDVRISGVVSTDDYPGSAVAAIVSERLRLPATPAHVNLLCQHKYYARRAQAAILPDAVPKFGLLSGDATDSDLPPWPFPFFVKPVKSFFSICAQSVTNIAELQRVRARFPPREFFRPIDCLLRRYSTCKLGTNFLICEELLRGLQVTVEGYAFRSEIEILGIVDSVFFPGTISFQRFEYPSRLPGDVQSRMHSMASILIREMGFTDGMFNTEMMWDPKRNRVSIVEVNPRMSSQFADLFGKVDGTNSYSVLVDLSIGLKPTPLRRKGRYRVSASCVLRTFQDAYVDSIPGESQLERLEQDYPEIRVEVLCTPGTLLSEEMQDGHSFRYAIINIGADDHLQLERVFRDCVQKLGFVLVPVGRQTRGLQSLPIGVE